MKANENASAFAVYSGKISPSKGQKRRRKAKEKKNMEESLSKVEKIDLMRKKKEKKRKILLKNGLEPEGGEKEQKQEKKFKRNISLSPENQQASKQIVKKKKKKLPTSSLEVPKPFLSAGSKLEPDAGDTLPESAPNTSPPTEPTLTQTSKKSKKKVQISSELPLKKKSNLKKVVISTPRFVRKPEVTKSKIHSAQSNILKSVDSYISKREIQIDGSQNAPKGTMLQKLASEAKTIAEKQRSSEAFGEATLQKLLEPFNVKSFQRDHWEKKPLHIPGKESKFKLFISTEMIDSVLRDNVVLFGKHLDVTTYTDGLRETHNLDGRAHAHVVWDFYSNGCSVRLLNPQYFMHTIHILCSHLQEYFGCFVGANVYLTPPNSQGFAPHYDDIEAIILQVEGSKIWKIYSPMTSDGYLPRYSSRNLTEEEVGEPIMEVTLKAGDLLYFPRGFIHQAKTESQHSLHITLSTYQKTSWVDFMEKLLPLTLQKASKQDVEFRKGMPLGYLESAGFVYKSANQKKKFIVEHLKELMKRMTSFLEVDSAMDEMGLKFVQEALPPVFTPREAACSVLGGGLRMEKEGIVSHRIEIASDTCIRWIRHYCFRVVEEDVNLDDGTIERQTRIYYTLDNSKEYCKEEPQYIIIPPEMAPAVVHLVSAYPEYTKVSDLPGPSEDDKVILVGDLFDRGLLMTEKPLEAVDDPTNENIPMEEALSKEESEVYADLLEAVPLGHENGSSGNQEDNGTASSEDDATSVSSQSDLADQDQEIIKKGSDSESDVNFA